MFRELTNSSAPDVIVLSSALWCASSSLGSRSRPSSSSLCSLCTQRDRSCRKFDALCPNPNRQSRGSKSRYAHARQPSRLPSPSSLNDRAMPLHAPDHRTCSAQGRHQLANYRAAAAGQCASVPRRSRPAVRGGAPDPDRADSQALPHAAGACDAHVRAVFVQSTFAGTVLDFHWLAPASAQCVHGWLGKLLHVETLLGRQTDSDVVADAFPSCAVAGSNVAAQALALSSTVVVCLRNIAPACLHQVLPSLYGCIERYCICPSA